MMICNNCNNSGWVCEEHPNKPWEQGKVTCCSGAGMPCEWCNNEEEPRDLAGMKIKLNKDGWRN